MNRKHSNKNTFSFKNFTLNQADCTMKVTTDSILLGAWSNVIRAKNVLDIGTGTGILALMLAQKNPHLVIDAIEFDSTACSRAMENVRNNAIGRNITVLQTSIQEFNKIRFEYYDVIISNPPYFLDNLLPSDDSRKMARHTLYLSQEDLLKCVVNLLKKDGFFYLILPVHEGALLIEKIDKYGLFLVEKTEVCSKVGKNITRFLLKLSRTKNDHPNKNILYIMEKESADYTVEFKNLTKDFYLNF
ncbi:MAG: methyltransferase [Saprospiraceae bacterium]